MLGSISLSSTLQKGAGFKQTTCKVAVFQCFSFLKSLFHIAYVQTRHSSSALLQEMHLPHSPALLSQEILLFKEQKGIEECLVRLHTA